MAEYRLPQIVYSKDKLRKILLQCDNAFEHFELDEISYDDVDGTSRKTSSIDLAYESLESHKPAHRSPVRLAIRLKHNGGKRQKIQITFAASKDESGVAILSGGSHKLNTEISDVVKRIFRKHAVVWEKDAIALIAMFLFLVALIAQWALPEQIYAWVKAPSWIFYLISFCFCWYGAKRPYSFIFCRTRDHLKVLSGFFAPLLILVILIAVFLAVPRMKFLKARSERIVATSPVRTKAGLTTFLSTNEKSIAGIQRLTSTYRTAGDVDAKRAISQQLATSILEILSDDGPLRTLNLGKLPIAVSTANQPQEGNRLGETLLLSTLMDFKNGTMEYQAHAADPIHRSTRITSFDLWLDESAVTNPTGVRWTRADILKAVASSTDDDRIKLQELSTIGPPKWELRTNGRDTVTGAKNSVVDESVMAIGLEFVKSVETMKSLRNAKVD